LFFRVERPGDAKALDVFAVDLKEGGVVRIFGFAAISGPILRYRRRVRGSLTRKRGHRDGGKGREQKRNRGKKRIEFHLWVSLRSSVGIKCFDHGMDARGFRYCSVCDCQ